MSLNHAFNTFGDNENTVFFLHFTFHIILPMEVSTTTKPREKRFLSSSFFLALPLIFTEKLMVRVFAPCGFVSFQLFTSHFFIAPGHIWFYYAFFPHGLIKHILVHAKMKMEQKKGRQ